MPGHEGQPRGPWTIYVCNGCGFTALEPVKHMYQYPRLPVPGFHQHTAAMMLPVEVVPVQQQPERGAEDEAIRALRELVTLKDGPRDEDYERRKPLAWDAARSALARLDTKGERDAG